MSVKTKSVFIVFALLASLIMATARAEIFTGDTRLACEAILCLSTGNRPSECAPSINRFFSISFRKWSKTLRARRNFLSLCPDMGAADMQQLKEDIVNGTSALCQPNYLLPRLNACNDEDSFYGSLNAIPQACLNYANNENTRDIPLPVQVTECVTPPANCGWFSDEETNCLPNWCNGYWHNNQYCHTLWRMP